MIINELFDYSLKNKCEVLFDKVSILMNEFRVGDVIEEFMIVVRVVNKYIDLLEFWNLNKNGEIEKLSYVLYSLVEMICFLVVFL